MIVMGDVNSHIGLLGDRVNQNAELLIVDEMSMECKGL